MLEGYAHNAPGQQSLVRRALLRLESVVQHEPSSGHTHHMGGEQECIRLRRRHARGFETSLRIRDGIAQGDPPAHDPR